MTAVTEPRVWTCSELLRLAATARARGDEQTASLITSGCFGFAPDEPVPVSDQAAAMLAALEMEE